MSSPHQVTRDFEKAVAEYAGAPYCVAVNSCTMALLLATKWFVSNRKPVITIPSRTYISVPMSIIHAGAIPAFANEIWEGAYRLRPLPVWDSARWFTTDLWKHLTRSDGNGMVCVSFHASKTLGIEQGGAILHGYPDADEWLRRMRFDGRTEGVAPKNDNFTEIGHHCYMNPSTAAQGLLRLHSLDKYNAPIPNDDYPDLSQLEIFK